MPLKVLLSVKEIAVISTAIQRPTKVQSKVEVEIGINCGCVVGPGGQGKKESLAPRKLIVDKGNCCSSGGFFAFLSSISANMAEMFQGV